MYEELREWLRSNLGQATLESYEEFIRQAARREVGERLQFHFPEYDWIKDLLRGEIPEEVKDKCNQSIPTPACLCEKCNRLWSTEEEANQCCQEKEVKDAPKG